MAECAMPGCVIEGEHAMSAHMPPPLRIRVAVTAEHIAAAGLPPTEHVPGEWSDPVERAIAELTGQAVMCDEDVPGREIATIGQGEWTLVINLPPEQATWIDRYYRGEAVEPFEFAIEIPDWIARLVGGAA